MRLIATIILAVFLTSCSTTNMVGAISAYQTAPTAVSILKDYIGEDEQVNTQLAPQIIALQTLYDKARAVDSKKSFIEFFNENQWQVQQAQAHWKAVVAIVGQYSQRTKRPIPQELIIFSQDVNNAYIEVGRILAEQKRDEDMSKYIDLLALMMKLGAASQGVII